MKWTALEVEIPRQARDDIQKPTIGVKCPFNSATMADTIALHHNALCRQLLTMNDRRMTAWNEWKERCAAALCSPESQTTLQTFGGMRFRTLVQRCLPIINVSDVSALELSDADAWHLLECHMTLPNAVNGKAYKQWLFARLEGSTDAPFDVIQAGATLLMRWVVREHLRSEYLPRNHLSLDQPPPLQPSTEAPLSELLPGAIDTRNHVEQRELMSIATQQANEILPDLPIRLRLALIARHLNVPLTDPLLLAKTQCSRSALRTAYHTFVTHTFERLRTAYPQDDRETVTELAILTLEALTLSCLDWADQTQAYRGVLTGRTAPPPELEVTA